MGYTSTVDTDDNREAYSSAAQSLPHCPRHHWCISTIVTSLYANEPDKDILQNVEVVPMQCLLPVNISELRRWANVNCDNVRMATATAPVRPVPLHTGLQFCCIANLILVFVSIFQSGTMPQYCFAPRHIRANS